MSSTFSYSPKTHVLIGEVIKAQGLHGELKIFCYSGQPENLSGYKSLVLAGKKDGISTELSIQRSRIQGSTAIVLLEMIADRNTAEQYIGRKVFVAKKDLPMPSDGEFYWLDMQGKNARTSDGRDLGKITHLFSNGAHDIMVISDGRNEYLVPVLSGIVLSVDQETVLIEPPPGLLEINNSRED